MTFATKLDAYCRALDCTHRTIAERCGLSASTLSRLLSGKRTPEAQSETIEKLARGIAALAREHDGQPSFNADEIRAALEAEISGTRMVGMDFHMRLDMLMHLVGMSNASLAEVLGVDPSYISRIRRGQRSPMNLPRFAASCSHLAAHLSIERKRIGELGELVGIPDLVEDYPGWNPENEPEIAEIIEVWLTGSQIVQADMAKLDDLFTWLDEADFTEWLSLTEDTDDEEIEAPSSLARFYYGVGGMRSAEIEFLSMAANTRSRTLSLSSDTPLLRNPPDPQFIKRYARLIKNILKTGCHIIVFFNLERPLESTIQSLRMWIPAYMTGQVDPYYLKGVNNRLFFHMNYVCDTCALSSEAVVDHEEEGRYYFTTRPEDVAYYQRKMGFILEKASRLFELYRECDAGQRQAFEKAEAVRQAKRRSRPIGQGRFRKIKVTYYHGDCTVLTLPCGPTAVHFVIRHPKINYIVSHMK